MVVVILLCQFGLACGGGNVVQFRELVDGAKFLLEVADAVCTMSTGYSNQSGDGAYNKAGLPSILWLAFENVSWDERRTDPAGS